MLNFQEPTTSKKLYLEEISKPIHSFKITARLLIGRICASSSIISSFGFYIDISFGGFGFPRFDLDTEYQQYEKRKSINAKSVTNLRVNGGLLQYGDFSGVWES